MAQIAIKSHTLKHLRHTPQLETSRFAAAREASQPRERAPDAPSTYGDRRNRSTGMRSATAHSLRFCFDHVAVSNRRIKRQRAKRACLSRDFATTHDAAISTPCQFKGMKSNASL